MGWSNRTWTCPFFKWDERLCVHCEGGRVRFPDGRAAAAYTSRYCASANGWKLCTLAAGLTEFYEREDKNREKR